MWNTLPSFAPLFLTLPEEVYRIEPRDGGNLDIMMLTRRREVLTTDLARYKLYAPLVECVDYDTFFKRWQQSAGWDIVHRPHLWAALEHVHPVPLSNLRRVQMWQVFHDCGDQPSLQPFYEWFEPSYIFLGASMEIVELGLLYDSVTTAPLQEISEEAAVDDQNIVLLLKALAASPRLSKLHFGLKIQLPETSAAFSDALGSLVGLVDVTIDVEAINARAWRHLSSLHTLRSLSCRASSPDLSMADARPTTPTSFAPFPSLTDLHLFGAISLDMCTLLFGTISSARLSRIRLYSDVATGTHAARRASFKALTVVIAAHPAARSLRTICIGTGLDGTRPPWIYVPDPVALPAGVLEPLTTLSQLTHLELAGDEYAAIDDTVVAGMAKAWPEIVTLSLCPCGIPRPDTGDHRTSVTVAGLAPFANHAHLEGLNIALADIDASTLPPMLSRRRVDDSGTLAPPLILGVGNAWIDERAEREFAVSVSTLFPRLAVIRHLWVHPAHLPVPEGQNPDVAAVQLPRWNGICRLVSGISRIRVQERNWRRKVSEELMEY
ncbi:hypothetical protein C8Q80DRAFT_1124952 [Daedaleopsis nitida]|nr:hypothetical protein C8Q80DRAFT_1124952 [Daedaleopsis nitida]